MRPSYKDGRPVVPKVVLFYCFTPLRDPEAIRLWQHELCDRYGLRGRILISADGINATVGGPMEDVKRYVRGTKAYPPFRGIDVKWSAGTGADFPRLSVKVRTEIVTFGVPDEVAITADGVVGGGTHLSPEQVHELVDARGQDVVFFDGRNAIEAQVGRFRDAVVPDVGHTRDFISELDSGAYDHLKSRPVVTYCTGGIRCEVLTVLMRNRGFEEVYQIDGGIVRYAETFGDDGLWDGSLFVFDKRLTIDFSDHTKVVGRCVRCDAASKDLLDCSVPGCLSLEVTCAACQARSTRCRAHAPEVS